jgi:hypothetical protein
MEIKELAFRTKLKWFAAWGDRYFNMNYIVRRISPHIATRGKEIK